MTLFLVTFSSYIFQTFSQYFERFSKIATHCILFDEKSQNTSQNILQNILQNISRAIFCNLTGLCVACIFKGGVWQEMVPAGWVLTLQVACSNFTCNAAAIVLIISKYYYFFYCYWYSAVVMLWVLVNLLSLNDTVCLLFSKHHSMDYMSQIQGIYRNRPENPVNKARRQQGEIILTTYTLIHTPTYIHYIC